MTKRRKGRLACWVLAMGAALQGCDYTDAIEQGGDDLASQAQALTTSPGQANSNNSVSGQSIRPLKKFRSSELPRALVDRIKKEHGEAVTNEVIAEFDAFQYVPSTAVPAIGSTQDPGNPMGSSFQEDFSRLEARIRTLGPDVKLSCEVSPCRTFQDFDGDGKTDLAVQVANARTLDTGLAVVTGSGKNYLLGAGADGQIGRDLGGIKKIHVIMPRAIRYSQGAGLEVHGTNGVARIYFSGGALRATY
ncbi:MAG: hypothetical protein HY698_08765 [Deltaproteobacteria bacterium]|nr:hypothetical protein [Deltaproteobacteria bacterium]